MEQVGNVRRHNFFFFTFYKTVVYFHIENYTDDII